MASIVIEARRRERGNKNVNLRMRKAGSIPGVMYGPGKEPIAVALDPSVVSDILHSDSGRNTIITVNVEGNAPTNAMIKDYQLHPLKGNLIHADLMEIAMDRLIEVTVNIEVQGEAEGVKIGGGIMDFVTRSVEVECLPGDIPESIQVDVSHLKINEYLRVKNIVVSDKIKVLTEPDVVIVTVVPPIKEELPAVEAPAATAEPEVIKKGKAPEEGAGEEPAKK
jgi:large subunit ribosomal protein L25